MVEAKEQQNGGAHHGEQHSSPSLRVQLIQQYSYMLMWIVLSASVILVNKYVLSFAGFPYPVALTCLHMLFCATLSHGLVRLGLAEATPITPDTYISCILPIGLLFAGVLWTGNAAYLYLSVSFIQMLKASMPMIVYVIGVLFTTEVWTMTTGLNMVVVATGIAIASYGELLFDRTGVMLQVISVVAESVRLCLIQILLQRRGIKLNPIATLYHIAPCCFVFLALPFTYMELPRMMADENLVLDARMISLLLLSASIAFALNMAVFLLIGKTSALTMNVAGVCKDWLLILLSVVLYGSPVTSTQLFGYGLAFLGVMYYNWRKVQAMKASQAKPQAPLAADSEKGKR